jgi:transcriptional regulator with XRE-family HTH domain
MEQIELRQRLSVNLKKQRKNRNWSQFELAEKADISEQNFRFSQKQYNPTVRKIHSFFQKREIKPRQVKLPCISSIPIHLL